MNFRRQPKRRARAAVNGVGAALFKGFAAECPDEGREIHAILMRLGVQPTGSGVRAERQHHDIDGRLFFGWSYGLDPRCCHNFQ